MPGSLHSVHVDTRELALEMLIEINERGAFSHIVLRSVLYYENVLIVCHGGIIRSLCGYLEDRKNGIKWRPKPNNCEIRVYESNRGKHTFIETFK